ncbi:MAG: hypothetical protein K0S04_2057 [Herbinix sp.]|jgi:predicted MPP superfamily phosphohydrolase|nr:hypothetical protein [Herbinix sp.]
MEANQIIVGLIILILIWTLIEQKLLITKRFLIKSQCLPQEWDGTKLVVLADLHNCSFGKNNERLAKKIDQLAPDYILVVGDMINKMSTSYPSNSFLLLERLAKKYKIYYSYGNHEQKLDDYKTMTDEEKKALYSSWNEYREGLTRENITLLDNKSVSITKNGASLRVTGLSLGLEYFERHRMQELKQGHLKKVIGEKKKDEFQILMAHHPFYFKDYADWGADLIVSGHVHGGMVRLPGIGGLLSPQAKFFPKYQAGLYKKQDKSMVVSRGLGSHSVMPRLFNIPEIVFLSLKKG